MIIADIRKNLSRYKGAILKIAQWTKSYHPRTVYMFYEYYFSKVQFITGYVAKYRQMNFAQVEEFMKTYNAPVIMGTKMTHGGHMIMPVGINKKKKVWIVEDPNGNAMKNYKDGDGEEVEYPFDYHKWTRNKKKDPQTHKFNCLTILRDEE